MLYLNQSEFEHMVGYIKKNYGLNLSKKKLLIEGRLSSHVSNLGFNNYMDYFEYAKMDTQNNEMLTLINKLTTNHTYFLREEEHFKFYKDTILPWVDHNLKSKDLRVWSAGCSSGQEPYTLSMVTMDYLGLDYEDWDSTILASDISDKVLKIARDGIYSKEELKDIPENWMRRYFTGYDEQSCRLVETIRKNVAFRNLNLLSAFNFKKPFHAIFCRNVMIYFDAPTKDEIVNKFYDILTPGGYLIIGHSESLASCKHHFKYIKPSIYQKDH